MTTPRSLLEAARCSVSAAAGCGKTQLIADAVALSDGRELVLTHTNAGVQAIRHRIASKKGGNTSVVSTMDSWCQSFIRAFPSLSGTHGIDDLPAQDYWPALRVGMLKLMSFESVRAILKASHAGVFVDEYQDCGVAQHQIVAELATLLPVRVLGDPMQAIFNFGSERVIGWDVVEDLFEPLPSLAEPHRWSKTNPQLGSAIQLARGSLEMGTVASLSSSVVTLMTASGNLSEDVQLIRNHANQFLGESVAVIFRNRGQVERFSRASGGAFQIVESVEPDIMVECRQVDAKKGDEVIDPLVRAVQKLAMKSEFERVIKELTGRNILAKAVEGSEESGYAVDTLDALTEVGFKPFRWELWWDLRGAIDLWAKGRTLGLGDALRKTRAARSRRGRVLKKWHVGLQHVLKGLEFDHTIVCDSGEDPQLAYVSISRASKTMAVMGEHQFLKIV